MPLRNNIYANGMQLRLLRTTGEGEHESKFFMASICYYLVIPSLASFARSRKQFFHKNGLIVLPVTQPSTLPVFIGFLFSFEALLMKSSRNRRGHDFHEISVHTFGVVPEVPLTPSMWFLLASRISAAHSSVTSHVTVKS